MRNLICALAGAFVFSAVALGQTPDKSQQGSAPTPKDRGSPAASSQRGSEGATAGGEERTGAPGAGIESGDANGLAGGRTDEGPRGGTGIRNSVPEGNDRARARAADQLRGPNAPGSFERPAETPAQMNRSPRKKSIHAGKAPARSRR
jgi:hypothetical protein